VIVSTPPPARVQVLAQELLDKLELQWKASA